MSRREITLRPIAVLASLVVWSCDGSQSSPADEADSCGVDASSSTDASGSASEGGASTEPASTDPNNGVNSDAGSVPTESARRDAAPGDAGPSYEEPSDAAPDVPPLVQDSGNTLQNSGGRDAASNVTSTGDAAAGDAAVRDAATAECALGQYWDEQAASCVAVVCEPGEHLANALDASIVKACVSCEPGTFSAEEDAFECTSCSACAVLGEEVACGLDSDTVCDIRDQFGTVADERVFFAAADATGNQWIVGRTSGDFGSSNGGGRDGLVRHYPAAGGTPADYQLGTIANDSLWGVTLDSGGNAWVVGETDGDFAAPNLGTPDAIVRKYPADGAEPVDYQFGTEGLDTAFGVFEVNGEIWATGYSFIVTLEDLEGEGKGWVWKLRGDGSEPELETFGPASEITISLVITADSAGNVWVAGCTSGALASENLGSDDAFVRKYPADGGEPVDDQFGTAGYDCAFGIAADSTGNVWVTGTTAGADLEQQDAFVRVYPADGSTPIHQQFGTPENDDGKAVHIDAEGNAWIAVDTSGSLGGQSRGGSDVFVRKYPVAGGDPVDFQIGSERDDFVNALTWDARGGVWASGYTRADLGGEHFGETDGFIYRVSP